MLPPAVSFAPAIARSQTCWFARFARRIWRCAFRLLRLHHSDRTFLYLWNVVPYVGVDAVQKVSATSSPTQPAGSSIGGPAAFQNACVVCQEDDVIRGQRLTRAQWDRELKKMTGWGAQVKDADRDGLLEYLFNNYGPQGR